MVSKTILAQLIENIPNESPINLSLGCFQLEIERKEPLFFVITKLSSSTKL